MESSGQAPYSEIGRGVTDKELLTILWNMYKEECEWTRHNELQRATLTTILLAITAAFVGLIPKERLLYREDCLLPAFIAATGLFGMLAVSKYWERFCFHREGQRAFRQRIDQYFPEGEGEMEKLPKYPLDMRPRELIKTREAATRTHNSNRMFALVKDSYSMQHWLWIGVFLIIFFFGLYLFLTGWKNGSTPPNLPNTHSAEKRK